MAAQLLSKTIHGGKERVKDWGEKNLKITPNLKQPDKSTGRDGVFLGKISERGDILLRHPPSVPSAVVWLCHRVRGWVKLKR